MQQVKLTSKRFREYCKLINIEDTILKDNRYTVYKCTIKKEMDLYELDYNYPYIIIRLL